MATILVRTLAASLLATLATVPAAANAAVAVNVNTSANSHPFSPLIFGVSYGDAARNAAMGYTVRRWGGNSTSRYNWKIDIHNTGFDYYYENIPGATDRTHIPPLNNDADAFVSESRNAGIDVLMTIPTIGWTPLDGHLVHPYRAGFSVIKYGPQEPTPYGSPAVDPYDTDAGTGECLPAHNASPNCVSYDNNGHYHLINNDPHDTSATANPAFQKDWVAHLQSTFGGASAGGVRFYSLDNEVMLWNSTHRDVHPLPTTYDETWTNALNYGTAIKQQDPSAQVTGPVTWGYCDLFGSAKDNCLDGTDRQAHGGMPFVAWYLQQVCANPLAGGGHVVDYLDLHYYPQGQNIALNNDDSTGTAALRLRSLKELYNPAWVSESWMSDLGDSDSNHYSKPNLIPRARAWIDQYCPGTKLAITEYNWGNDGTNSGAIAQAELFGIFAREGVDMATRWVAPDPNTKAERAFTLFLNYDGAGAKVQGNSVSATSANVDQIGAYAFVSSGRTMVLLTNKTTSAQDATLTFAAAPGSNWTLYGFDATHAVHQISSSALVGSTVALTGLPAMSANLLVVTGNDVIFKNSFE
ncbi:MAG: glycoside hydrolase family 44 protein [Dokdonella sp.]